MVTLSGSPRILKYLKGTLKFGIIFQSDIVSNAAELVCYLNSD